MLRLTIACFFILFHTQLCLSQNSIWFNASIKNHPRGYMSTGSAPSLDGTTNHLFYQGDIGISLNKSSSPWGMDISLLFRHTKVSLNYSDIEPYYGFVFADIDMYDQLNFAGLKTGVSYSVFLGRGTDRIFLPIGLQAHLPFASNTVRDFENSKTKYHLYRKDRLKYGFLYGLYFKPTYQFKFSKRRNTPWSFGVYAEADLLMLNLSESNPKFTAGGGLEVRYTLN